LAAAEISPFRKQSSNRAATEDSMLCLTRVGRLVGISLAAALLLGSGVAWAQSPHYVSGPTSGVGGDDIDYTVSFKEAGLGNTITQVDYSLTVNMSVTYQCFNHGGNLPQGTPFTVGPVATTTNQSFPVRNGSATGTMIAQEPEVPSTAKCTGNGTFCAVAYSYTGAVLTDPYGNEANPSDQNSGSPYLNCKID
jgi:hypothetical protein